MVEYDEVLCRSLPQRLAKDAAEYASKYVRALDEAAKGSADRGQDPHLSGEYESHGRNLGWAAAVLGAAGAAAVLVNLPVVAGYLTGTAILTGLSRLLFDDRKARARNQAKARQTLTRWLRDRESEVTRGLLEWYSGGVEGALLLRTQDRIALIQRFLQEASALQRAYLDLTLGPSRHETDRARVQRCVVTLYPRLAQTTFNVHEVQRVPGRRLRAVTSGEQPTAEEIGALARVLGEHVEVLTI